MTSRLGLLAFILGSIMLSRPALAVGSLFTYEGVLTDAANTPINTPQTVNFQILYGACIVYEESQIVTPGTQGEFSVIVGAGTRVDNTGNTADRIFAFSGNVNCYGASATTIAGFATRSLHIRVGGQDLSPDITLGNIPFAINSQRLNDKSSTDFLQVNAATGTTQANLENTLVRYTDLNNLLNAYVGNTLNAQNANTAVTFTGALVGDVTGAQNATAVTKLQGQNLALSAPTAGQVLKHNGSNWVNGSLSYSDVTTGTLPVSALPAFTGDATSTAGTSSLSLAPSGVAAGTYPKVTVDTKGRVTSGSVLVVGDIPALTWSHVATGAPTTLTGYGITDAVKNLGGTVGIQSGLDSARPVAGTTGRIYISSDQQKIYRDNGSAWDLIGTGGAGGGTVTNVTANLPIAVSNNTTTPVISISQATSTTNGYLSSTDWNAFNSKLGTNLTSGQLWIGNVGNVATAVSVIGDMTLASAGTATVTGIQGRSVSATTPLTGQVLRYTGSSYVPSFTSLGDLKATISPFGPVFASANCTPSQSLTYESASDTFICQNIAFSSQPQGYFLASPTGAAGTPQFRAISSVDLPSAIGTDTATPLTLKTNATAAVTIDSAGRVGIGTVSPSRLLSVAGGTGIVSQFSLSGTGGIALNSPVGTAGYLYLQKADLNRWGVMTNASPESGSNAGSDFSILRYDDAGTTLGSALVIQRSTGNVGVGVPTPAERVDITGGNIKMGYERLTVNCTSSLTCSVTCTAGKQVIGGGCALSSGTNKIVSSYPDSVSGWRCVAGSADTIDAYAICANMR